MGIWYRIWVAADRFMQCFTWQDACSPAIWSGTIAYAAVLLMVIFAYYLVRRKNWVRINMQSFNLTSISIIIIIIIIQMNQ